MEKNPIKIELSKDEALVLFEFLGRLNKQNIDTLFEDQAEQRVLWDIESTLEKALSEPFLDNYLELLNNARAQVRDAE